MNEPSVFEVREGTFPPSVRHIKEDGTNIENLDVHNAYGAMMQWATYDALLKRDPGRRPFLLTRSSWIGGQKYGAIWTGDNMGKYSEVRSLVQQFLSLSVAGYSFHGADIPGFFGDFLSEDLVIDFYRLGQWMPFMRAHSQDLQYFREPWFYSDRVQSAIRESIFQRYSFIHYM